MLQLQLVQREPQAYEVRDSTNTLVIGRIEYMLDRFNQPCEYAFLPKDVEIKVTAQTITGVLMKHFDDMIDLTIVESVSDLRSAAFAQVNS